MEKISNTSLNIAEQLLPTLSAFHPLLEKNKEKITSVPKQSFKFGDTERHFLDVYYPESSAAVSGKAPILFFIYGGAFTTGSRNRPAPFDLLYSCIGAFFALKGFITIIPDYRLAPEFKYPEPVKDVVASINWAASHPSNLVLGSSPKPDLDSIFLSGHSAGAIHVATILFHPSLIPVDSDLRRRIKGLILMSGGYHFLPGSDRKALAEAHWGSEANAAENSPTSLLLSWSSDNPGTKLPKILIAQAEREPEWIYNQGFEFKRLLEWHFGESIAYLEGKGHNHISLSCCLSSGEGEEWAVKAAQWVRDVLSGEKAAGVDSTGVGSIPDGLEETDEHECPKCQKRKARSFEVKLGTQNTPSKNFASCLSCGNRWSW